MLLKRARWLTPAVGAATISVLVGGCAEPSRNGPETPTAHEPPTFVGTIWTSTDSSAAPGTLRVFLSDGILIMDSCTETYRLARWESLSGDRIAWHEDGARIEAAIARADPDELQLRLSLVNDIKEEN
jgi:hypothetical protein